MLFSRWFYLSVAASVFVTGAAAEIAGDPKRGQQVYKKCANCHMVGPDARNRVGPLLNNILAAKAAGVAEFRYSKAMKKAAEDGLHWTPETLDTFLRNPKQMIPRTKMSFRGLKSEEDRIDVIAYLANLRPPCMPTKRKTENTRSCSWSQAACPTKRLPRLRHISRASKTEATLGRRLT